MLPWCYVYAVHWCIVYIFFLFLRLKILFRFVDSASYMQEMNLNQVGHHDPFASQVAIFLNTETSHTDVLSYHRQYLAHFTLHGIDITNTFDKLNNVKEMYESLNLPMV